MARISLDVEDEVHNKLKALAALQGLSLKDFMLSRALENTEDEDRALAELKALLERRVERAEREGPGTRSVEQIFSDVLARKGVAPSHG